MQVVIKSFGSSFLSGAQRTTEFTWQGSGGEHIPQRGASITYSNGRVRVTGLVRSVNYDYTGPELCVTVDVEVISIGGL